MGKKEENSFFNQVVTYKMNTLVSGDNNNNVHYLGKLNKK